MTSKNLNKKVLMFFSILIGVILSLHLTLSSVNVIGKPSIFYLDHSISLGNHYVTAVSFITGGVFFILASHFKGKEKIKYALFSLFFFFLSYDEYLEFHEDTIHTIKNLFSDEKVQKIVEYNWVIALSIPGLLVLGFIFYAIYKEKNYKARLYYLIGVILFMLLMTSELISISSFEKPTLYFILITIEETFEMTSVTFFLAAALEKLLEKSKIKR